MKTARYLLMLLACILGFWPQHATHAAREVILLVSPFEGHNGDTLYLSGSGYLANEHLTFLIACPSLFGLSTFRDGNWGSYVGPQTNDDGDFSGYAITGFMLHVLQASPCVVYADYAPGTLASGVFVCTRCGYYNIVAPDTPLPARARYIEGHVSASPQRVRAGITERIHIYGAWGGSQGEVTIRFPHHKPRIIGPFSLDWLGRAERTVRVDSSAAAQAGSASVSVSFSLGDRRGSARTSFMVVR